jgi:hypothetical protein
MVDVNQLWSVKQAIVLVLSGRPGLGLELAEDALRHHSVR